VTEAERFLAEAIALARDNVDAGGRPFGAVLVKHGAVVATGVNEIHSTNESDDARRAPGHPRREPRARQPTARRLRGVRERPPLPDVSFGDVPHGHS
jgi:deoxycytidylate deaminase